MKSVKEIMNMLEAFDLTGSCRDAGELAGVWHHTVARYVQARKDGDLSGRAAARPELIDGFLAKVEEWIERSNGSFARTRPTRSCCCWAMAGRSARRGGRSRG